MRQDVMVDRAGTKLNREGLERLLARLDADRDHAGEQYEKLRRKLIKLFECRRGACPESLADETIDRVSRKLDEVEVRDLHLYVLGVARNVLKENRRSPVRNEAIDDRFPARSAMVRPEEAASRGTEKLALEERLECLERCMRHLPAEHRALIIRYYECRGAEKIERRREMARERGVSAAALRVQAHRIREKLAECVKRCLEEHKMSSASL